MRISYLLVLVALLAAFGCSGGSSGAGKTSTDKALVSILIQPSGNRLAIGTSLQFTAIGTYSDNTTQDLTASASWSSSNTAVATITPNGMATAVAAGTADITASVGSSSPGRTALTVLALDSLKIDPELPVSLAEGMVKQLKAIGHFSDNSTKDLTAEVTWSTDTPSVATVAPDGALTAQKTGSANITATWGKQSSSVAVTVTPADVSPANFTGTWSGKYQISDYDENLNDRGKSFSFKFTLYQNGSSVDLNNSSVTLRDGITVKLSEGTLNGQTLKFGFNYFSPVYGTNEKDEGTATLIGSTITGNVVETHLDCTPSDVEPKKSCTTTYWFVEPGLVKVP